MFTRSTLSILMILASLSTAAVAQDSSGRCFRIPTAADAAQTWCYVTDVFDDSQETVVMRVDAGEPRPEAAMLVVAAANGSVQSVAFANRVHHNLEIKTQSGSKPSPVAAPLTAARAALLAQGKSTAATPADLDAAAELREILSEEPLSGFDQEQPAPSPRPLGRTFAAASSR